MTASTTMAMPMKGTASRTDAEQQHDGQHQCRQRVERDARNLAHRHRRLNRLVSALRDEGVGGHEGQAERRPGATPPRKRLPIDVSDTSA